jgi:hypothetical protein
MAGSGACPQSELGCGKIGSGENEQPGKIRDRILGADRPSRYYCVHFSTCALVNNQEITTDSYGAILGFAAGLDKVRTGQFVTYDAVIYGYP